MRGKIYAHLYSVGLAALAGGCGSSSSPPGGTPGYYISITNLSYSPLNLEAPPGATITVINNDPMAHSVTSEATPGSFALAAVDGISFDTGPFTGRASFTLPSTAAAGTVVYYFCVVHLATMNTPNATITINPNASPSPPPG